MQNGDRDSKPGVGARNITPTEYRCPSCGLAGGYSHQPHLATCPRVVRMK